MHRWAIPVIKVISSQGQGQTKVTRKNCWQLCQLCNGLMDWWNNWKYSTSRLRLTKVVGSKFKLKVTEWSNIWLSKSLHSEAYIAVSCMIVENAALIFVGQCVKYRSSHESCTKYDASLKSNRVFYCQLQKNGLWEFYIAVWCTTAVTDEVVLACLLPVLWLRFWFCPFVSKITHKLATVLTQFYGGAESGTKTIHSDFGGDSVQDPDSRFLRQVAAPPWRRFEISDCFQSSISFRIAFLLYV